jgi:hypothetical protein
MRSGTETAEVGAAGVDVAQHGRGRNMAVGACHHTTLRLLVAASLRTCLPVRGKPCFAQWSASLPSATAKSLALFRTTGSCFWMNGFAMDSSELRILCRGRRGPTSGA